MGKSMDVNEIKKLEKSSKEDPSLTPVSIDGVVGTRVKYELLEKGLTLRVVRSDRFQENDYVHFITQAGEDGYGKKFPIIDPLQDAKIPMPAEVALGYAGMSVEVKYFYNGYITSPTVFFEFEGQPQS